MLTKSACAPTLIKKFMSVEARYHLKNTTPTPQIPEKIQRAPGEDAGGIVIHEYYLYDCV